MSTAVTARPTRRRLRGRCCELPHCPRPPGGGRCPRETPHEIGGRERTQGVGHQGRAQQRRGCAHAGTPDGPSRRRTLGGSPRPGPRRLNPSTARAPPGSRCGVHHGCRSGRTWARRCAEVATRRDRGPPRLPPGVLLRRRDRVLQQAGDGHRPHPAGHRGDGPGHLRDGGEVHVAHQPRSVRFTPTSTTVAPGRIVLAAR